MEKKVINSRKWLVLFAVTLGLGLHSQAQTFSEWFFQKKTQIKYLYKQIAALQAYMTVLEKGYAIVHKGTGIISEIKQEDLAQHTDYFHSLSAVNTEVKQYPRVGDILSLAAKIGENCQATYAGVQQRNGYSNEEVSAVHEVMSHLLDDCTSKTGLLQSLITDGDMQMTDEQRLQRINTLYASLQAMCHFSVAYRNSAVLLGLGRQQEQREAQEGAAFYGLK